MRRASCRAASAAALPHGLHEVADLRLFVSRGVGGVSVPLRTCAPPDVGVLDLVPRAE